MCLEWISSGGEPRGHQARDRADRGQPWEQWSQKYWKHLFHEFCDTGRWWDISVLIIIYFLNIIYSVLKQHQVTDQLPPE